MAAVVLAVVLANLPYLLGIFVANPLGPRSGLVSSVTPGLLAGQSALDPNDGVISQALGHRAMLDVVHGQLPWWNPYSATGVPLAAEMQSAALFVPTLLTLLSNGQLYEHMLFELAAGVSTLLLLRRLSVNRWAAAAAGVAFALNGTFSWFAHAPVNPVALAPMLLLGLELAYSSARLGRPGGWWLIAVAGALSYYAGFPEVAYIDSLLGMVWFAWRCSCLERRQLLRFLAKAASGAAVAVALCAPLLIAMVGYFNHADLELHAGTYVSSIHLDRHGLAQLALPYLFGPIYAFPDSDWGVVGGFISTSIVCLALLGVLARARRRLSLILVAWIVLALARIYDEPHLLGAILGVLPGMSRVEFARYAWAAVELPMVILAAFGIDFLAVAVPGRRRLVWSAVAVLVGIAGIAVAARPFAHSLGTGSSHTAYFVVSVAWGLGAVLAVLSAGLVKSSRVRVRALAVIVAVDAAVLFAVPQFSAPRAVRLDLAPVAYLQRHLGTARFVSVGPFGPNYGAYYGTPSLNISDGAIPENFARFARANLDPVAAPTLYTSRREVARLFRVTTAQQLLQHLPGYRAAGVAYILVPAGQALPQSPATFRLVLRTPSTWIYRVAGTAPYYTLAGRCRLEAQTTDSATVACASPAVLVRRETWLHGWSASVDGHSTPLRQAAGLFQAVAVPAGRHHVTFSYDPPGVGWGWLAFAAGWIWLLAGVLLGRRSRRGAAA